ncbi:hypothetical protein DDZ14_00440 [Maritimibacter sp. 55A14]|uniref:hypothetical protein n=1 Tax=Maritimibacter sp. 55A14 TaxID=2174844 RepID=UPI000D618FDD|nr:hypothetical protein [Maritimibacter sp. 55A14]PWE34221.1 hypothetical protein DDZ14_00440 [Maritimibacter sp. 55A14]
MLNRTLAVCAICLSTPAWAEEPLSAIDWLSDTVREAPAAPSEGAAPDIADSATVAEVTTRPLDAPDKDAVGLLPPETTGLPRDLWAGSSTASLVSLIARQRTDALPAIQDLLYTILLAEADPPADSGPEARLLLARLDKLLELGALEQSQALLERAGPTEPEIFRRWFDVSLLTGHENHACATMRATPAIAPTLPARVFCLARGGDWNAAVLTMETGETLGRISEAEADLLARFLDPALFEGTPDPPAPERLTPLIFRIREAIAAPRPPGPLPLAFLHTDLSPNAGWKAQLDAAERLARNRSVPPGRLIALYTGRKPAASGGVWDRVRAVQAFDVAMLAGDTEGVATWMPRAWQAMREVGLEVPFARYYGARLALRPLTGEPENLAFRIALLSDGYQATSAVFEPQDAEGRFLKSLALGNVADLTPPGAVAAAIADAFSAPLGTGTLKGLLDEGRLGEAILRAMLRIEDGAHTDPDDIQSALALMRQVGLEDVARRTALQLLLLDARG